MFETYASFGMCLCSAPCPTNFVMNSAIIEEAPTTVVVVPLALFILDFSTYLILNLENHPFTKARMVSSLFVIVMCDV